MCPPFCFGSPHNFFILHPVRFIPPLILDSIGQTHRSASNMWIAINTNRADTQVCPYVCIMDRHQYQQGRHIGLPLHNIHQYQQGRHIGLPLHG